MRPSPLLLTLLLLAAAATALRAQAPGSGRGGGLLQGIEVSEAQRERVDSLQRAYQRDMMRLRDRVLAGDSAALRERDELRTRRLAEIRAQLTPPQQARFDSNVTAIVARRGDLPGGPPPAAGGAGTRSGGPRGGAGGAAAGGAGAGTVPGPKGQGQGQQGQGGRP